MCENVVCIVFNMNCDSEINVVRKKMNDVVVTYCGDFLKLYEPDTVLSYSTTKTNNQKRLSMDTLLCATGMPWRMLPK